MALSCVQYRLGVFSGCGEGEPDVVAHEGVVARYDPKDRLLLFASHEHERLSFDVGCAVARGVGHVDDASSRRERDAERVEARRARASIFWIEFFHELARRALASEETAFIRPECEHAEEDRQCGEQDVCADQGFKAADRVEDVEPLDEALHGSRHHEGIE